MISRFYLDQESIDRFPRDLLDGSKETARVAERIMREMGFGEDVTDFPSPLEDRLSWAIAAIEETPGQMRLKGRGER